MGIARELLDQLSPHYKDCVEHIERAVSENAALYVADIMLGGESPRTLSKEEAVKVRHHIHHFYCFSDPLLRAIGAEYIGEEVA